MVKFSSRKEVRCGKFSRPNFDNQFFEGEERNVGDSTVSQEVGKKKEVPHGINETLVRIGSKMEKRKKRATSQNRRMGKFQDSMSKAEVEEIHGYRFTNEEDAILKDAVLRYIKEKHWEEEEGLERMLVIRKNLEAYGCWSEIKRSLPHRPCKAIRQRALKLFDKGSFLGRWSNWERELLRGSSGVWTREEMQQLSDLVHACLRLKRLEDRSSRRLLRDNISWDKISGIIGTHSHSSCCEKWYRSLSAAMVTDGLWASKDDFLLLESLLESGACMEEEVDWNSLLPHRSGQTCLFRWKQLAKHLGENRTRGFLEKLDSLARRYAPELLCSNGNQQL